jgi:hypothetical protein
MEQTELEILEESLEKSERTLNRAYGDFMESKSTIYHDIFEVRLQFCIFQFDMLREMVSVHRTQSTGFAESVALKGIVHRLFEYDILLRTSLRPRLLKLAQTREIEVDTAALKELDVQTKPALKVLRKWSDIRNKAAGHYDADLNLQVKLIGLLKFSEVMEVVFGFIRYNMALLIILRDAGYGKPET